MCIKKLLVRGFAALLSFMLLGDKSTQMCISLLHCNRRYERLNDPKMDPVVVKAVRSFAKKKKIVTHDSIIG